MKVLRVHSVKERLHPVRRKLRTDLVEEGLGFKNNHVTDSLKDLFSLKESTVPPVGD